MLDDQLKVYAALVTAERQNAELFRVLKAENDAAKAVRAAYDAFVRPVLEYQRLMAPYEQMLKTTQEMRRLVEAAAATWDPVHRQMAEFAQRWTELPPRLKRAYSTIGSIGWYSDDDMALDLLTILADEIEAGNRDEVEEALERHFESRLDTIEASLAAIYPNRAAILAKAFAAHRRGDFELSVPVFLAQADGICIERCGESFFGRIKGRPKTAKYVQGVATNPFEEAALHFLSEPLPIAASPKSPDFQLDALNRHAVLHGTSTTYGTLRNSLKAVSLLQYLASAFAVIPAGDGVGE